MSLKKLLQCLAICLLAINLTSCGKNIEESEKESNLSGKNSQSNEKTSSEKSLENQSFLREAIIEKDLNLLGTAIDLNKGIDFHFDIDGETPLTYALKYSDTRVIRTLLNKSKNINLQNKSKNTPLHLAVLYKKYYLLKEILKLNPNSKIENENKSTPLDIALFKKDQLSTKILLINGASSFKPINIIKELIAIMSNDELTNLFEKIHYWKANKDKKTQIIEQELKLGLTWFLEYLTHNSNQFLDLIQTTNSLAYIFEIPKGYQRERMLNYLIRYNAPLNGIDQKTAPIYMAIADEDIDSLKILLKNDANFFLEDLDNNNTLSASISALNYDLTDFIYQSLIDKLEQLPEKEVKLEAMRLDACEKIPYETRLWYRIFQPVPNKIFNLLNCDN